VWFRDSAEPRHEDADSLDIEFAPIDSIQENIRTEALAAAEGEGLPDEIAGDLPTHCLRGIRKQSWIVGTIVQTDAFLPDVRTAASRVDGSRETSINWEDDHSVLAFTLQQRAQSEHGVARLPRAHLDEARRTRHAEGQLAYERREEDDNPYHGNLLFSQACTKPVEKMIASMLALDAEFIPRTVVEESESRKE
jgi:hypothetical protein